MKIQIRQRDDDKQQASRWDVDELNCCVLVGVTQSNWHIITDTASLMSVSVVNMSHQDPLAIPVQSSNEKMIVLLRLLLLLLRCYLAECAAAVSRYEGAMFISFCSDIVIFLWRPPCVPENDTEKNTLYVLHKRDRAVTSFLSAVQGPRALWRLPSFIWPRRSMKRKKLNYPSTKKSNNKDEMASCCSTKTNHFL